MVTKFYIVVVKDAGTPALYTYDIIEEFRPALLREMEQLKSDGGYLFAFCGTRLLFSKPRTGVCVYKAESDDDGKEILTELFSESSIGELSNDGRVAYE
jgi:hypothetical protein